MSRRPQRGFPYDSTLPLLAAFVLALAFLGGIAVYATGGSAGPRAQAEATTATATQPTTTTPVPVLEEPQVTLSVTSAGDGKGTVRIDDKPRDCRSECRSRVDSGTTVTLVARAASGSKFVSWTGSCGTPRRCEVAMDGDRSVLALFALAAPPASPAAASCEDGLDDDGDGFIDDDDPECLVGDEEDLEALPEEPGAPPPPPVILPPPLPEEPPALPPVP